jgi:hypothetical protein
MSQLPFQKPGAHSDTRIFFPQEFSALLVDGDNRGLKGGMKNLAYKFPPRTSAPDRKPRPLKAGGVHQIAHEGDREASGAVRHIQPQYAIKIARFIENLVFRLNRVVYPTENIVQPAP